MRNRTLFLAAALLASLPTVAQLDEGRAYFSISSSKTFRAGEKPSVQFWAQGVDTLHFRVYRVNDPVLFFRQLDEPHRFGGRPPRRDRAVTPLERFHNWKLRSRTWIREVFRRQFRPESRSIIRDRLAARQRSEVRRGPIKTEFAEVPVLNPQQLVLSWQQSVPRGDRWQTQTVPVEITDKGLYLVEATNGRLQAYTIISVTGLAILAKGAPGHIEARVVERGTGVPIPECELLLVSGKEVLATLRTDANGFASATPKLAEPETVLLLARRGQDFAAASIYGYSLSSDEGRALAAYIYTDRPVYRPGHTVHYRAVLRSRTPDGYAVPSGPVEVEIQDSEGKTLGRRSLALSPMGTLHGDFAVPATAALGYYGIELRTGQRHIGGGGFHVEEYKKPEYEVRVTPAKPRYLQGEEVQALIDARYYYGEPVPGAKVTYVVHRSYYWSPWYEPEEQPEFESGDQPEYYAGEQVLEESGALDADGKLAIRFPAPELRHDSRYRIEARVTDAAGREIAGVGWAIATVGSYQIHIQAESYVYTPGQRARFRVETRDYDGKPVPNAAFRAEMSDERWPRPQRRIVTGTQGTTGADGKATFELPVESGLFAVRAVSRTPEGREVESSTFVWGSGGAEWYGPRSQRVQIVPDKRSYKPGETARVLIVTGVPEAHVWVTVEGRAIRSSRAVHVKGATATVEVPIDRGFAPNFYVAASFIRDNQLYQGVKSITVPPEEQTLSVAVKTSKPRFLPGESGTISIEAKDHRGLPVAAEFSLGVVDEAIYAIRRDAAEDILKFFYGRTYNSVAAASSLEYYFHGEAGRRRMQLARIRPPGALAVIKPERLVEPRIRKAFPDTILWLADLKTDAQGRAEARVAFPDSLTTWRATARGVTSDTKVGSALEKAIVRKNVIVRLAVPRFFTEGDEVTVSAIVSNYLPVEKQVRVSLAVEGLELIEGRPGDVTVPTRGQAQVDYRVRASRIGTATLVAKGLTDVESDALELEIPVRPAGVKLAEARAGSITGGGGSAEAELVFPPDAAGASRSLEIMLTPSVAGAIFGALDYLTTFPYGCTEQIMSSFLPNVIVSQAVKELGLQSSVNQSDLLKKIRAGLERLYDFQHEDGGWGWWKSDDSEAFMTAYVYFGLQRAQAAGYQVRTDVISKARGYLRQAFANQKPGDVKAYMLLALVQGEDRDQTWFDSLWNDRGSLSAYGQALLGLAMRAAGDGRADQLAATLERTAEVRDGEAFWKVDRDGLLDIYQDATVEATAHALKFLAAQRPSGPLLAKAALYLVNHRDEGYYWTSTKQTAMVIYGLTDYLKTTGELRPNHAATVWVNGRQVASKRFTEADALKPAAASIRLTGAELSAGRNAIRIAKSGPGRLYWSAREEYFSTSGRRERAGSVKLNLVREYFRLLPVRSADRVVHELEPLAGEVQRGDVLAVRLTLSGGDWRYLMIEDPIPAGAEFIERDDLYQLTETPVWWRWMASRREFHDDRAAFFQRYFNAGQDQYVYLLKVVNPGRFRVNPAKVQPMYQPQLFATSDARILEVK